MKIAREEYFQMVSAILSGIASNHAITLHNTYDTQNATTAVLQGVIVAISYAPEPPDFVMDSLP